jgi:large subunit ribosomal protein L22
MERIRPAPMGRAYRYQRRLTHIVLSVAERASAESLVTRVEEPAVATKPAKTAKPAAKPAKKAKSATASKVTKKATTVKKVSKKA